MARGKWLPPCPHRADGKRSKCRICHKEYHREYCRKNKIELARKRRERYHASPERQKKQKLANRAQQVMKRAAGGVITPEQLEKFLATHTECARCGTTKDLTIDHIVPKSKGGTAEVNNLQVLCVVCNVMKGQSTDDYREDVERWLQAELFD